MAETVPMSGVGMGGMMITGQGASGALTTQAFLPSQGVIGGPNPTGLFGIFDGHGGVEVAEFVSRHFEETLK